MIFKTSENIFDVHFISMDFTILKEIEISVRWVSILQLYLAASLITV